MKWNWKLDARWSHVLLVFLTARLTASIAGLIGGTAIPPQATASAGGYVKPVYPKLVELFFGIWERSDSLWYLHIARDGYNPATHDAAFMPFYPFLIRVTHYLTLTLFPWLISGLLVSNVACVLALYLTYRLVELEFGEAVARRSSVYLMFFPGSVFFLVPYTESTFVMLAAGAMLAARTGRWRFAGLAAAALTLTRNMGAVILVPLFLEWLRAPRRRMIELAWLLPVPFVIVGWMFYWQQLSGDPLAFVHVQAAGWQREPMLPWSTWLGGMSQSWNFALHYPGGIYLFDAFAVLAVTFLGIIGLRRLPLGWSAWIGLAFFPALTAPYPGRMLMSCIRFTAVLFPAFATLALLTRDDRAEGIVRAVLTALFGLSAALYVANQYNF